jgi:hypothetical protein
LDISGVGEVEESAALQEALGKTKRTRLVWSIGYLKRKAQGRSITRSAGSPKQSGSASPEEFTISQLLAL